jgi:hypothetical protein
MAAIILPNRWVKKPPRNVGISPSLSAKTGTIWLSVFQEPWIVRDAINGKSLANPGGSGYGIGGEVATFNGSQQGNLAFTFPSSTMDDYVICARIRATATQAGTPGAAFGIYASGGQGGFGVGVDTSNNVGCAWLTNAAAGIAAYKAGAQNEWYTVYSCVRNSGSNSVVSAWINGLPATTNQDTSPAAGAMPAPNELAIGAQHRSSGFLRQFKGDIEWASIIYLPATSGTRRMSDEYAAKLYAESYPYSLFQPITRRIHFNVAAAPTGFQPAWAANSNIVIQGAPCGAM